MIFLIMLLASAISLASAAGYFSVIGLSETYAASVMSVIIMGTCLEVAKLVLASFIHKYWSTINILLKGICCSMLATLMFITSYGVFSHLTSAYQQDSAPLTEISSKLTNDKTELDRLVARKSQMDNQIAKLPDNYAKARTGLIKSFGEEYTSVPKRIDALNAEITDLNSQQVKTESKIGPIIYLAKVLGWEADKTVFWFTALITAVFDPLAVTLVFAYNIALTQRRKERKEQEEWLKQLNTQPDNEVDMDEEEVQAGNPEPNADSLSLRDQFYLYNRVYDTMEEELFMEEENVEVEQGRDSPAIADDHISEEIEHVHAEEDSPKVEESIEPETPKQDVLSKMYEALRAGRKPVN